MPAADIVGRTTRDIQSKAPHGGASPDISHEEDLAVLTGKTVRKEQHDPHPVHGGERHRVVMKGACHTRHGENLIVGAHFDISPWWITKQDLQIELHQQRLHYESTQAFMQRALDLIPHPVYVKDSDGHFIIANRAMVEESGLSAEQLIGSPGNEPGTSDEDHAVLGGKFVLREAHDSIHDEGMAGEQNDSQERFRLISKGSCADARGNPVIVGAHVDLTELRRVERTLQALLKSEVALRERTEAFIQRLIDVIPDPVFIKKAGGIYVMINEAFAKYRNVDKLTFKGFKRHEPSADPALRAASMDEDDLVLAGMDSDKEDHTFRQSTGEEIFRVISKRRSVFVDGDPVIVGVERHITRWKLAERELKAVLEREMAQRLRTEHFVQDLIDVIPDPVYVKSADGKYIIVNEAFARRRCQPREELLGLVSPSNVSREEDAQVIAGGQVLKEEHKRRASNGEEIFRIVCKRRCINVDGLPVVVGIDHYITEWRLAERELKRLAEEDVLTGIANRRHFSVEAQRALEQARRHGEALSILMFDLDHFKHINDQHGHNVGDEVLREMAIRMQECLRVSDLPGRWGGEEFIALLPHTSVLTAHQVGERLRARLADQPVATSAGMLRVTLSSGGAQLQDGDTLESLVARADMALYRAKNGGRNRVEISLYGTMPSASELADG